MLDNQEIFNLVASFLITQQYISILNGICQYHSGEKRCAVGILISNEDYKKEFDLNPLSHYEEIIKILFKKVNRFDLIFEMQIAHDECGARSERIDQIWFEDMKRIADKFNLNSNILFETQAIAA